MSRTHQPNNAGMHQLIHGPQRPYGKCPHCKQTKPMYWVSLTNYLCYPCMKKAGKQPYHPTLAKESHVPPSNSPRIKRKQPQTPKPIPLRPQKKPNNTQQHKQKIPTKKIPTIKEAHSTKGASPGATDETLARWERNRQAVEGIQQQQEYQNDK